MLTLAESTGGIGRHVATLADGLRARDVRVTVCGPASTLAGLGIATTDVEKVVAPLGGSRPAALIASRRILATAARSADVVHAHGLRAGALAAASRRRTPLVVTWHNAALGGRWWRLRHAALRRYTARAADLTLAASDDLAADAAACGAKDVRSVFVSVPPLPPARRTRETVRADLGIADRPMVLAIGRLQQQKRLDVLVAAAAAWSASATGPVVVIAGDGPARAELIRLAEATGADVRLLGARDDVPDLLAAADVVALPSEWEARSIVAQEALRAGVPLVTTAAGGLPGLVGSAAQVVPVGDADALRTAIETVLSDPELRRHMIERGLAQAASWPTDEERLDELVSAYLDLKLRLKQDRR